MTDHDDQAERPPHRDEPTTVFSNLVSDWFSADLGGDVIRSFSEVNRRGFEAAGELISKMTEIVDGVARRSPPTGTSGSTRAASSDATASIRREVLASIDTWAEMMGSLVDSSFELLRRDGAGEHADAPASVVIGPVPPGGHGSIPIFAHAIAGQGLVRCRAGRFESAGGATLDPGSVSLDPDVLIEGRDDHFTVNVDLAASAVAGRYHGFVFAEGLSDAAIAVEICVSEPR